MDDKEKIRIIGTATKDIIRRVVKGEMLEPEKDNDRFIYGIVQSVLNMGIEAERNEQYREDSNG